MISRGILANSIGSGGKILISLLSLNGVMLLLFPGRFLQN